METAYDKYESVIRLEVHTQLLTHSKANSSDSNEFGVLPNINVSTVTLSHPGILSVVNKKTEEVAINLDLAIKSDIQKDIIDTGGEINTETQGYDAPTGTTFSLRSRELAHNYRYFPEPDLQPVKLTEESIKRINRSKIGPSIIKNIIR